MEREFRIAVGGFACETVSDADLKLHDHQNGLFDVICLNAGDRPDRLLQERLREGQSIILYSTLAGRFSSAIAPLLISYFARHSLDYRLEILELPHGIREFVSRYRSSSGPFQASSPSDPNRRAELAAQLKECVAKLSYARTRKDALDGKLMEMIDLVERLSTIDPDSAVFRARKALEYLVGELYAIQYPTRRSKPLFNMIDELAPALPKKVLSQLHFVRQIGNLGVHHQAKPDEVVTSGDAVVIGFVVGLLFEWYVHEGFRRSDSANEPDPD